MCILVETLRLAYEQRCPKAYKELMSENPDFFAETVQDANKQIDYLTLQMMGPDIPGETEAEKTGRMNATRLQAKEIILHDLIPEPEEPDLDVDGMPMERFEWDWDASVEENLEAQEEMQLRIFERLGAYQSRLLDEEEESDEED